MRLRLSQNLSRLMLARRIGFIVGPSTIEKYENSEVQPRYDAAREIAFALKVDLNELTESTEAPDAEG